MSYSINEHFSELQTGDIVDIFILRSLLHESPLAQLFVAQDLLSREQVVLKVPTGDIINHPVILYHYQNEDRISQRIDHPGIINYIHRQKSREYIIMTYTRGKELRSRIRKGKGLPLDESVRVMLLLCDVMAYLHGQGIVHLDMKPENILCLKDGSIKILDFGLATCRELPDLLTADLNSPQGTPWYVSPEQLSGERRHPGCDIYSMGMIFYEMVSGSLPWPRSSKMSVARRRLSQDPVPPRYHNRDVPPQIQTIIMKAISRSLDQRYQSVEEMTADLRHWQDLPVTENGLATAGPPWWKRIWPGKSIKVRGVQPDFNNKLIGKQVIGALINEPDQTDVLKEVKRQALIHSCEVTLVHIIEEENDSELRRYGLAVEGERLKSSLEQAVQLLRRFNIDPTIRLIRGDVTDSLTRLCRKLQAQMLVIGKPRKKRRMIYSETIPERLQKTCTCTVRIAEKKQHYDIEGLIKQPVSRLGVQQLLAVDIFLVDLWYDHLHFHTDFIYRLLLHTAHEVNLNGRNCRFGQFLAMISNIPGWIEVFSILNPIHQEFHDVAHQMAAIPKDDHRMLHDLYTRTSLPLSCNLKYELGHVARLLREQLEHPPPVLPFLADTSCPVELPTKSCYGPILKAINLDKRLTALSGAEGEVR